MRAMATPAMMEDEEAEELAALKKVINAFKNYERDSVSIQVVDQVVH